MSVRVVKTQLLEVVDLAVVGDDQVPVLVEDGLAAAVQVDDGQPPEAHAHVILAKITVGVRPAVGDAVRHGPGGLLRGIGDVFIQKTNKSAHAAKYLLSSDFQRLKAGTSSAAST